MKYLKLFESSKKLQDEIKSIFWILNDDYIYADVYEGRLVYHKTESPDDFIILIWIGSSEFSDRSQNTEKLMHKINKSGDFQEFKDRVGDVCEKYGFYPHKIVFDDSNSFAEIDVIKIASLDKHQTQ